MERNDRLPFVVHVDGCTAPGDVIEMLTLGAFVAGTQPWAQSRRLQRVRPDATLLPHGVTPARSSTGSGERVQLAVGDGWTLRSSRWRDGVASVTVIAVSDDLAADVLRQATDGATMPLDSADREVTVGFWHRGRQHAQRVSRAITVAPWAAIRANYTLSAVIGFDQLVARSEAELSGRLLLVHGPPGTGKTTALRAVAQAWHDWCQVDFILDPERLLGDAAYLTEVLLGDDDDLDRWHLLVLEDCDELLRADAKEGAGQSLSRLLNLTDGMLGQGLKVLVCLTTNEELMQLHPAVTRPGRCLAQIHVGPLTRDEARAWLGADHPGLDGGATLAELFAMRGGLDKIERAAPIAASGQYLWSTTA